MQLDATLESSSLLGTVANMGAPISLSGVSLCGVTATAARANETVSVFTRMSLTSDDDLFHQLAPDFITSIASLIDTEAHDVDLVNARNLLLVVRADDTADLWVDTAAVAVTAVLRRPVEPMTLIYQSDIADISAMSFPQVPITSTDSILCIFREGWRFAMFFDFNPDGDLNIEGVWRELGRLSKRMKYKHLYSAVADPNIFKALLENGWFPFTEIANREFRDLANCIATKTDLAVTEEHVVAGFSEVRLNALANRWQAKPAFGKRSDFINEAIRSFLEGRHISVIKIVSSEIEGVLRDAYIARKGKNTRHISKLLDFALEEASARAGDPTSLLLPKEFIDYLRQYTFAQFEPGVNLAGAGSRHAVNHGAADAVSYTSARALQSLLTLDQLGFYL